MSTPAAAEPPIKNKRVRTPTMIQMEAVECGAAALGIVLGYYGANIPLEELRSACGVSRNGVNALNIVKAARFYGLTARGKQVHNPDDLKNYRWPLIAYWNFNHFLVIEGFDRNNVYLNDPAVGPRIVTKEEFDQSYTGIALIFEPSADFKKRESKKNFLQALVGRLKGLQQDVFYVFMVSVFLMITGLVIPTFSRVFVDNILVGKQDIIVPLLIGMGLTALLRGSFSWIQKLYLLRLETKLAITSSSKFLWHVLRLPSEFFAQRYAGDISNRVDINDRLAKLLSEEIANALLNMIVIVFYVILMFRYDVLLTLVGILIAALNLIAFRFISRRRVDASIKLQQEQGKLQGVVMNGLQIIETLKSSATEANFFIYYGGFQAKALDASQEMGLVSAVIQSLPPFLTALNTVAILVIGGIRVMDGTMTIGMLVAFQSLMASFIMPFNQLVSLAGSFQEVSVENDRLNDILQYPVDPQLADIPAESHEDRQPGLSGYLGAGMMLASQSLMAGGMMPAAPAFADASQAAGSKNGRLNGFLTEANRDQIAKLSGYLELKGVSFGYSKLETALIEGFDLSLTPGDRVALVGSSGSGKSTVAKVVSGLYAPWRGEILFDGKPRPQLERAVVTNSVAMVDQDIFLFEGTIRDNLTMWDSTIPEADIIQAAKDACIHDEITSRPGGYDAPIDEGGRNFSGGQRQRIEIARALVANPSLLILDEATSALDSIVEKTVFSNIRRRGCTCLVIAHRLSTIRDCDEIIVLERGKVVERGTHDRLYGQHGAYTRLVSSESYQQEKTVMQSILEKL